MQIKSDNKIVQQQLEFIVNTVLEHGGIIHPDLLIHCQDQQLWITCTDNNNKGTLLSVPKELFIPTKGLQWLSENGMLVYKGNAEQITSIQHALLGSMVCIFNAVDKLTQTKQMPSQILPNDPELLAFLITNSAYQLSTDNLAEAFINTRLLTVESKKTNLAVQYLMPLIDLLNHHPYAPNIQHTKENDWLITLAKPNQDSFECYLQYNKTDSLYNAFMCGYFEKNTRFMVSLNTELQHHQLGLVRVVCKSTDDKFLAPRILSNESVLTLQDVILEQEKLPALRTFFGLAVRSKYRNLSQAQAEIIANELIELLVEANRLKYQILLDFCSIDTEKFPLRTLFGQVANHHLKLLADLHSSQ